MSADHFSNRSERNALFSNSVIPGPRGRRLFNCEPEQTSSIESVHCRPAIESVACIDRHAFFTCNPDGS